MKHVLVLFTDQQRFDTIGALGNPNIQTPNLDALAGESVFFQKCMTPSPVCVPARLSMFSGQYPARTGCNNNNAENQYKGRGYYSVFTDRGYQSCCVGKMHHLVDPYGNMGFEKRYTQEELSDPRDDYTKFVMENYPYVFDYHGMRSEMYYVPQISQLPAKDHPTQWVGDHAVSFIEECDPGKNMFLMTSFIHPHPPFCPPAPWQKLYRDDLPEPWIPAQEDMDKYWDMLGDRCSCKRLMISKQDLLRMKNFYYACVSFVDYQIGRVVKALKDKGMYEDTMIVFASDHGDMMGDYASIGKRTMVDSACHVPLMIKYPGKPGGIRDDVCSLVDLAPTILSYAGITYDPAEYDGINLFEQKHNFVFSQHGCGNNGSYMVTDGKCKLVYISSSGKYHFFDKLPEDRDVYSETDVRIAPYKEALCRYMEKECNHDEYSNSAEPVTKKHPHYPARMDHIMRHNDEMNAIPEGYCIDLN